MSSVTNKPLMAIAIMLSVVMLNVIMLNVILLNVILLNVILLNVIMLSVIMLCVVAPKKTSFRLEKRFFSLMTKILNENLANSHTLSKNWS